MDRKTIGIQQEEIAEYRREREIEYAARNPGFSFGYFVHRTLTYAEAAFAVATLGQDGRISLPYARALLIDELIPEGYVKPAQAATAKKLKPITDKIMAAAAA